MPVQSVDIIVIGTGSAGKTVAEAARNAGKSVAIIDRQPFGGTCSQRGCDPKKVLAGAAEIIARSAQMTGKGHEAPGFSKIPSRYALCLPDAYVRHHVSVA